MRPSPLQSNTLHTAVPVGLVGGRDVQDVQRQHANVARLKHGSLPVKAQLLGHRGAVLPQRKR